MSEEQKISIMITETEIKDITKKIVDFINPQKILLFGSYANGTANKHSDLDLLVVVENSELSKRQREMSLYNFLGAQYNFPKDILIRTVAEIDEWKNVRQAFITSISREAKVLYER